MLPLLMLSRSDGRGVTLCIGRGFEWEVWKEEESLDDMLSSSSSSAESESPCKSWQQHAHNHAHFFNDEKILYFYFFKEVWDTSIMWNTFFQNKQIKYHIHVQVILLVLSFAILMAKGKAQLLNGQLLICKFRVWNPIFNNFIFRSSYFKVNLIAKYCTKWSF